jgi:hypothetical protein
MFGAGTQVLFMPEGVTMPIPPPPVTSGIQFAPTSGLFQLDTFVDPSGAPLNVLDADVGFTMTGHVVMPNYLTGTGRVRLYGHELGGTFNDLIGTFDVDLTGAASPNDPPNMTYDWSITVPGGVLSDPSPGSGVYELVLSFVYENPQGGHTDIAALIELGTFIVV